jgi:hypothetical protein
MKPVGSFSRWIGSGVAVAALLAVSAAHAAAGKAVVRSVTGTSSYSEQGGDWKPLKNGQVLLSGSSAKSGVASRIVLFLDKNGPTVRLLEDTTLGIDRLDADSTGTDTVIETQLDLRQGTIQGYVNKLAAASKYEVKTPNTVAGVRESPIEYQISADGVTHVRNGSMMVAYTNPVTKKISTHLINEGQSFIPPSDPSRPDATPTVRATRPGEVVWTGPVPTGKGPEAPLAVVAIPTTEPFVSPIAPGDSGD